MRIKEFIKWYLNPILWFKPYFLNFIEEWGRNPDYKDHTMGRLELWTHWSEYDIDEFRFLTLDRKGFQEFREKWDFKSVSWFTLQRVKKELEEKFHDKVK